MYCLSRTTQRGLCRAISDEESRNLDEQELRKIDRSDYARSKSMSGADCLASFVERFGPEGALSIWREANLDNATVLPGPFFHRFANRFVSIVRPWEL